MSGDVVPETKDWRAFEVEPNESGGHFLSVSGQMKLANVNEVPHLILAEPRSTDPAVLILEVKVIPEGASHFEWNWKKADILQPVTAGQFATVRVIWQGVEVASVPVGSRPE